MEEANQQTKSQAFKEWALVELFGHQKIVGMVTETTLAGGAFLRVDVPALNGKPGYTRFINPSSVYAINPLSEEAAMAILSHYVQAPVQPYELPRQQLAGPTDTSDSYSEHAQDDDDHSDGYGN